MFSAATWAIFNPWGRMALMAGCFALYLAYATAYDKFIDDPAVARKAADAFATETKHATQDRIQKGRKARSSVRTDRDTERVLLDACCRSGGE